MGYKVVVAGATGNVGREMLNILAEREFPADEVVALASRRSLGTEVSYGDKTLKTRDIEGFDFTGYDIKGRKDGANAVFMALLDKESSTNLLVVIVYADDYEDQAVEMAAIFYAYD